MFFKIVRNFKAKIGPFLLTLFLAPGYVYAYSEDAYLRVDGYDKKIIFTDSKDSCDVDNVFSMVNIDSGKYEVEVSKKEDNWYEVYGTDNMIKTSMCLSLALNEKAILSMDGYSAGELIFDDGDSCNVEGVYSPVRL
ncbi:hypothetical protein EY915_01820 [Citrobacter braakii]|uniref:hypothetical protein n=1 Tax=Citrobacter braakii TaxID=57706 RepID=UPI00103C532C|nr:hypothetical protein [Citrobacter braakii]TCC84954.1 hypothetical protein EY915_01820 [Citrobacter braakii]